MNGRAEPRAARQPEREYPLARRSGACSARISGWRAGRLPRSMAASIKCGETRVSEHDPSAHDTLRLDMMLSACPLSGRQTLTIVIADAPEGSLLALVAAAVLDTLEGALSVEALQAAPATLH